MLRRESLSRGREVAGREGEGCVLELGEEGPGEVS